MSYNNNNVCCPCDIADIAFPATKRELKKYKVARLDPKPRTNFAALKESIELQERLTLEIDDELNLCDGSTIEEINQDIVETVKESVDRVCPKFQVRKKKEP